MTKQRNDDKSTEFGLWLRQQKDIDSSLGFVTTNIDYVWENYKTAQWMLIEEKRFMAVPSFSQRQQFIKLEQKIYDKNFLGLHLLQFEKTSPGDGKMFWDHKEISIVKLIEKLKFAETLDNRLKII